MVCEIEVPLYFGFLAHSVIVHVQLTEDSQEHKAGMDGYVVTSQPVVFFVLSGTAFTTVDSLS